MITTTSSSLSEQQQIPNDGKFNSSSSSSTDYDRISAFSIASSGNCNNGSIASSSSAHQKIVQHNYHDHASDNDDPSDDHNGGAHKFGNDQQRGFCRGGVTVPFPVKLHEMLDSVEDFGHGDIVSWQPHGRCFVVHKPREFKELIPKYFKLSKMASFQRQLNLYGFTRLTRGRDKGGYYHEFFLRGKKFLCHNIHRIKVKGTGVRPRSNPNDEPHLWEMSWVGCKEPEQPLLCNDDDYLGGLDISSVGSSSSNPGTTTTTIARTASAAAWLNFSLATQRRTASSEVFWRSWRTTKTRRFLSLHPL